MEIIALRFKPGMDLREELESISKEKNIKAGFILTCVGSLKTAKLRLADAKVVKEFKGPFEIISLVGTLSPDGAHLHIAIADAAGNTFGGHVKDGCIVNTTAELVIGIDNDIKFSREHDKETGYDELVVKKI